MKKSAPPPPHQWLHIQQHALSSERRAVMQARRLSYSSLEDLEGSIVLSSSQFSPTSSMVGGNSFEASFSSSSPAKPNWTAKHILKTTLATEPSPKGRPVARGERLNMAGSGCIRRVTVLPPSSARSDVSAAESNRSATGRKLSLAGSASLPALRLTGGLGGQPAILAGPLNGHEAAHRRAPHPMLEVPRPDVAMFAGTNRNLQPAPLKQASLREGLRLSA
mmetsp:Transcript_25850/g.65788  ORF Transcript_25850/g.65788 Transcript_25850/m.65788 type:complete len:221 (+) Transcript_25850:2-664(+)